MAKEFDKKFPFVKLGFVVNSVSGNQHIGDCPFCEKENKFHINDDTGQWDCKVCGETGNVHTFVQAFYDGLPEPLEDSNHKKQLKILADDRGFTVEEVLTLGIKKWDDENCWVIPVFNEKGNVHTLRFYRKGKPSQALTGMPLCLGNVEDVANNNYETIYLVEGEWDFLALKAIFKKVDMTVGILWLPGAETFKEIWETYFLGKNVVLCYDNDLAGRKGKMRAASYISRRTNKISHINWLEEIPNKYDIRDIKNTKENPYEFLTSMIMPLDLKVQSSSNGNVQSKFPHITESDRPEWEELIKSFREYLDMNREMEWGLKLMCSSVLALNFGSTLPLWLHIAAPPGGGKTELIMTFEKCSNVEAISNTNPRALVSGWSMPGGKDPSAIPRWIGKVVFWKDWTEHLAQRKENKEETESILRGAYDGTVMRPFANGIVRYYEGTFNLITGTTHEIYKDSNSSMGERFLIYHMIKGNGHNYDNVIRQSMNNSGKESGKRGLLQEIIKKFVEVKFEYSDIKPVSEEYQKRIIGLAQTVAMLRANVSRQYRDESIITHRAQHEVGTRIAKQLYLLLQALGCCNPGLEPLEEDYEIVSRVALDTCKNLTIEVAIALEKLGTSSIADLAEELKLSSANVRAILDDLLQIGFVDRERGEPIELDGKMKGTAPYLFFLTPIAKKNWENARLSTAIVVKEKEKPVHKFKKVKVTK